MPKLLTRLRIDEVSAVDRGAGDGVRVVLMKRHQDAAAKAPAALKKSVGLILGSDEDATTKRSELAQTFSEFATYMERNLGKARDDPNYRSVATNAVYPKGSRR